MTTGTMTELKIALDAKFREIVDVVAADLGLGDLTKAEQRAELIIDQWHEAYVMEEEPRQPTTRLEILLQEYHEISEKILDLRDDEMVAKR